MLLFEPCICLFTPRGNKTRENAEVLQDCRSKQEPGLIQEDNRAHCIVQFKNKFFVK